MQIFPSSTLVSQTTLDQHASGCRVSVTSLDLEGLYTRFYCVLRLTVVSTVWYFASGVLACLFRWSILLGTIASSFWWPLGSVFGAGMASTRCLGMESLQRHDSTSTYRMVVLPFNRVCFWVYDLLLDLLSSTGALMTYHALVCSIGRVPWLRTMDRIYLKLMVDGFVMENLRPEATSALCLFLLAMVETVARDVVSFLHGSLLAIAYLVQPPTMFVVASMPAPRLLWMPPSCMVPMTWTHNIVIGATCWIVLSHMLSRWELHEAEDLLVHGVRCGFVLWH